MMWEPIKGILSYAPNNLSKVIISIVISGKGSHFLEPSVSNLFMLHKKYLFFFWLAFATVILLSFLPLNMMGSIEFQDKLQHASAYAALYFLSVKAFAGRFHVWILAIVFVGLGILVEFAQSLTEYRKNDIWDALANASGVIFIAIALSLDNKIKGLKLTSRGTTPESKDE